MFSSGLGQIDHSHIVKGSPEKGMAVVKIGGELVLVLKLRDGFFTIHGANFSVTFVETLGG